MTVFDVFGDRLKVGGVVLVLALAVGVVLGWSRSGETAVYWSLFALSAVATLLSLAYRRAPAEFLWAKQFPWKPEADPLSLLKVLFVEHDRAFEKQLTKVFLSYGAHVDTLEPSTDAGEDARLFQGKYDVVIADAQLPYATLFYLKSALQGTEAQHVFVVLSFRHNYPVAPPSARAFQIVEAFGPERLRKEIENVLDAVPA